MRTRGVRRRGKEKVRREKREGATSPARALRVRIPEGCRPEYPHFRSRSRSEHIEQSPLSIVHVCSRSQGGLNGKPLARRDALLRGVWERGRPDPPIIGWTDGVFPRDRRSSSPPRRTRRNRRESTYPTLRRGHAAACKRCMQAAIEGAMPARRVRTPSLTPLPGPPPVPCVVSAPTLPAHTISPY